MDLVHVCRRGAPARMASLFPGPRPAARLERRRELAARRSICSACGSDTRRERRTPTSSARSCGAIYDPGFNTYGTRGGGSPDRVHRRPAQRRAACRRRSDSTSTSRERYAVRGTTIAPYLSVVNAYNAKNVFLYVFDYAEEPADATGDLAVSAAPVGRCHDSFLARRGRGRGVAVRRVVRRSRRASSARSHVPPTTPSVVVHAVLNPERDDSGRAARAHAHRRGRHSGYALRLRGSDRERAAAFRSPARPSRSSTRLGTATRGVEDRTVQPTRQGRAASIAFRSPERRSSSARDISCACARRRARTSRRSRAFRAPRCGRAGGLTRTFNRDHDMLIVSVDAVAERASYAVRVESPFGPFFLFTDSTRVRFTGDLRNLFAGDLQRVFIPGFRQDIIVAAVDSNFYDYYRTNNDPFTGAGSSAGSTADSGCSVDRDADERDADGHRRSDRSRSRGAFGSRRRVRLGHSGVVVQPATSNLRRSTAELARRR